MVWDGWRVVRKMRHSGWGGKQNRVHIQAPHNHFICLFVCLFVVFVCSLFCWKKITGFCLQASHNHFVCLFICLFVSLFVCLFVCLLYWLVIQFVGRKQQGFKPRTITSFTQVSFSQRCIQPASALSVLLGWTSQSEDNREASERDLGSCVEEFNQKKGEVGKLDQTYGSKAIYGRNTALDI